MRTYLLTAPRWAAGMYAGLFFGICIAVVVLSMPGSTSWQAAAVSGAVSGGLLGALMTLTTGGQRRDVRTAAGDLPLAQLPDAYRAAVGGPIPADPQVRAAAARVAQRLIQAVRQTWIVSAATAILLAVMAVLNTLIDNYGFAAVLAVAALAHATELYQLKRLRRRVERLSA